MNSALPALRGLALVAVCVLARPAFAEVPRFLHVEGFAHLLDGNPESTTLSEDGAIGLRPRVHQRFGDTAFAGGAAGMWQGDVVMARLDGEAQLVAIAAGGKVRTLLPLGERLVTRIVGEGGALWLATTGKEGARLQRIDAAGKVTGVDFGKARFVWDIVAVDQESVLIATGEPGQVLHVDAKGRSKVLFDSEEAHIKTLAVDAKMGTFAGGGERGVLYVGAPWQHLLQAKAPSFRALLDTRNSEVTALVSNGNHVFVSAVTGSANPAANEDGDGRQGQKPTAEVRSVLLRVDAEGRADMLAGSTDEMIFDLAKDADGQILVATGSTNKHDPRGRLYRIDPDHKVVSLLYQANSRRLTQLLGRSNDGPIIVAQNATRLLELSNSVDETGTYVSASLDAGVNARFGLVQVLGAFPAGSHGDISVRTGQTQNVDKSWSNWSKPIPAPGDQTVDVPNGRYAQMRLRLVGRAKAKPQVYRMRLTYLRQNLPPFIRDIVALEKGTLLLPLPVVQSADEARNKVTTVAEKMEDAGAVAKPPQRVRQVAERGAMTLKWLVEEPNGDDLTYTLWMRPAGGGTWTLVKDDLEDPFYAFHTAQLADGYYTFRVRASDARSNAGDLALSDTRDSRAILVDNTPPVFSQVKAVVHGKTVELTASVHDTASPMVAITYALDGAALRPATCVDGLVDGLSEKVALALHDLSSGSHTVTLRARDEADNEGYASATFVVP